MTDRKNPLDQALDLFVYAPVGLALSLRELVPQLAHKGRERVSTQAAMYKMVGQFAVNQGRQEAEKAVRRAREQADGVIRRGAVPPPRRGASTGPDAGGRPAARPAPAPTGTRTPPPAPAPTPPAADAAPAPARKPEVIDVRSLPIPGYDSLAASQVVPRLAGLSRDELEAVRAYEAASRKRKTILHRVEQLQTASGNGSAGPGG